MAESEAFVVDPELVEQGGVEVVQVDLVLRRLIPEFVGLSVTNPRAKASAGAPDGVAEGVVIPAILPLARGSPSKLPSPENNGLV